MRNASISHTGSSVVITCAPEEKSASCLVVYRAYGNSRLNVISNKTISVMVNLTNGNYTFAIFRKMNEDSIYRDPFISRMVTVGSVSPPKTGNGKYTFGSSSLHNSCIKTCALTSSSPAWYIKLYFPICPVCVYT